MKSLATFLFIIFATSLTSGCSTPMMRKVNIACKVIHGITSMIDSKGDSNTNVDRKESERHENITR